jgi:hypothetical protein
MVLPLMPDVKVVGPDEAKLRVPLVFSVFAVMVPVRESLRIIEPDRVAVVIFGVFTLNALVPPVPEKLPVLLVSVTAEAAAALAEMTPRFVILPVDVIRSTLLVFVELPSPALRVIPPDPADVSKVIDFALARVGTIISAVLDCKLN